MIVFSTMLYALGKELGLQYALAEWENQIKAPSNESLPCARFLARVKVATAAGALGEQSHDLAVHADIAATSIAKSRSRALHAALTAKADYWVSCDDDVEASGDAVAAMLRAASTPGPRIVFLPCWLRGRAVVGCQFRLGGATAAEQAGGRTFRFVEHSATCAFVVNRPALNLLAGFEHLRFVDDDGVQRLALFLEDFDTGRWYGEDVSFCRRARVAGIELVAVCVGHSSHDGQVLNLSEVRTAEIVPPA